ncbi:MAG: PIN domain-containing protein [Euryarchaeota archaeon]|nr:PIN domain-containing protein [Euryarchaeota archaeon]
MILIDSNIWVYLLDDHTPEHQSVATWFDEAALADELLVPTVVQLEVLHILRRLVHKDTENLAASFLDQELETLPLTTGEIRAVAITFFVDEMAGIGSRDAAIIAHARDSNAILATHDSRLIRLAATEDIPTIDPVTAGAATSAA